MFLRGLWGKKEKLGNKITNLGRFVLHIARLESILNFRSHSLGNQGLLEAELLFTSLVHHFQRLVKSSKKKLISHLIACTIFLYITLAQYFP